MKNEDLVSIINSHLAGSIFTFIATDYKSDSVSELFRKFNPDGKFELNTATVSSGQNDEVLINGYLVQSFLGQSNLKTQITFSIVNDQVQTRFSFTGFPQSWKMQDVFPDLTNTLFSDLVFSEPVFSLDSQNSNTPENNFQVAWGYPPDPKISDEDIMIGLSFSGKLFKRDLPNNLRWPLLNIPGDFVTVSGAISVKNGIPVFWLTSDQTSDFEVLGNKLPLKLHLISLMQPYTDAAGTQHPAVFGKLTTSITTGGKEIPFEARFILADMMFLQLESDVSEAHIFPFQALGDLIGAGNLGSNIPSGFPALNNVQLDAIRFMLLVPQKNILSAGFGLNINDEWSLFDGLFKFKDFHLDVDLSNPLDKNQRHLGITANGKLEIADIDLIGRLQLPDVDFSARLAEGDSINLTSLLKNELKVPLSIPQITSTAFYIQGNVSDSRYSFFTSLDSDWKIDVAGTTWAFEKLSLRAEYQNGDVGAQVFCQSQIDDIRFSIMAEHTAGGTGWDFKGNLIGASEISLTKIANSLAKHIGAKLPDVIPDISLKNVNISFNSDHGDFSFIGEVSTPTKVQLGSATYEVKTRVNLQSSTDSSTGKKVFSGKTEAYLFLNDNVWEISYELANTASIIEVSWSTSDEDGLSIGEILATFGLKLDLKIPEDLDLSLIQLSAKYDTGKAQLTLSGKSAKYGDTFITAGKDSQGKAAFIIGANLDDFHKLSDIPGIGKELKPADFLTFEKVGVMISTGYFKGYTIPQLPPLTVSTEGVSSDGHTPIQPMVMGTSLDLTPGISFATVLDFGKVTDPSIKKMGEILGGNALTIQASLGAGVVSLFAGLNTSVSIPLPENAKLELRNTAVKIQAGVLQQIQLQGEVSIPMGDQTLDFTGRFMISPTELTFAADAEQENKSASQPMGFNGVALNQIGISLGIGTVPPSFSLGLMGAFQLGDQPPAANKFAFDFGISAGVITPNLLNCEIKELDLPIIYNACVVGGAKLPNDFNEVRFSNLMIYWCTVPVSLPDGSMAVPGYGFNGDMYFFGWQAKASLMIALTSGIHGQAWMDQINLGDGAVVATSVDGKQGPSISVSTSSSPYFSVDFYGNILGLKQTAKGEITNSGFAFEMKNDAFGFLESNLVCSFSDGNHFYLKTAIDFELDLDVGPITVPGSEVSLGSLHLDGGFSGSLIIDISPEHFSTKITGSIGFQNERLTMPEIDVEIRDFGKVIETIEKQIQDNVEDIFGGFISDSGKYLGLVKDGVVKGADDTVKVLTDVYHMSSQGVQDAVKKVNLSVSQSVHTDITSPHTDTPGIHSDTPKKHIDVAPTHADVKAPHIDIKPVHTDIARTHIDTNPHWDVQGTHADWHGDTFLGSSHTDHAITPHGDSHSHTDNQMTPHGDSSTNHSDSTPHTDNVLTQHGDTNTPHADLSPHVDTTPHADQNTHIDT